MKVSMLVSLSAGACGLLMNLCFSKKGKLQGVVSLPPGADLCSLPPGASQWSAALTLCLLVREVDLLSKIVISPWRSTWKLDIFDIDLCFKTALAICICSANLASPHHWLMPEPKQIPSLRGCTLLIDGNTGDDTLPAPDRVHSAYNRPVKDPPMTHENSIHDIHVEKQSKERWVTYRNHRHLLIKLFLTPSPALPAWLAIGTLTCKPLNTEQQRAKTQKIGIVIRDWFPV